MDRAKRRGEMPYNHYVNRLGLEMPYTKEVLSVISPMKYSNPNDRKAEPTPTQPNRTIRQNDHFAYGALLFMNDTK
ncbi:MAG: hypothetical protein SNH27_11100 [Rikenellaceae bacterium]